MSAASLANADLRVIEAQLAENCGSDEERAAAITARASMATGDEPGQERERP